jgi:hypothetical protein
MKRITLLALTAGAIIIVASPASSQGVYIDLGNNPPPRYRDYDGPRYRDYEGPRYRDRERYGERGERGYSPGEMGQAARQVTAAAPAELSAPSKALSNTR